MAKIFLIGENHTENLAIEANLRAQNLDIETGDLSGDWEPLVTRMQLAAPDYLLLKMERNSFKKIIDIVKNSEGLIGKPVFCLSEPDSALDHLVDYFVSPEGLTWEQTAQKIKKIISNREKNL